MILPSLLLAAALLPQARLVPIPVEEMARRADVAGVAVVNRVAARLDPANGMIYTDAFLRFSEVWKGRADGEFLLTRTGGTLGETTVSAVGFDYTLEPGQEIVIFAVPSTAGGHVVVGMTQGLYRVEPGPGRLLRRESERGATLPLNELRGEVLRLTGRTLERPPPPATPGAPAPSAGPLPEAAPAPSGTAGKSAPETPAGRRVALAMAITLAVLASFGVVRIAKKRGPGLP
jgi:hypothetical protein